MFEESKSASSLVEKVEDLLKRFQDLKAQNEALQQEIMGLKAQNEAKDAQISKLENDLQEKELVELEVLENIESVLGR